MDPLGRQSGLFHRDIRWQGVSPRVTQAQRTSGQGILRRSDLQQRAQWPADHPVLAPVRNPGHALQPGYVNSVGGDITTIAGGLATLLCTGVRASTTPEEDSRFDSR